MDEDQSISTAEWEAARENIAERKHEIACTAAIDEAGITRPEGLKEVVQMCQGRHLYSEFARDVLKELGVAPKQEDE